VSFRLRVLVLVALVAVVATGVTAWLTLQQASRQITESADVRRETTDLVAGAITEYGRVHGTWEGVAWLVANLGSRTGERIRLTTEDGQVIVDTDHLAGRTARPVGSPPVPVNSRPSLDLPADLTDMATLEAITLEEIDAYRAGVLLAACLTRSGVAVTAVEGPYGVPRPVPDPAAPIDWLQECPPVDDTGQRDADVALARECTANVGSLAQGYSFSGRVAEDPGTVPDPVTVVEVVPPDGTRPDWPAYRVPGSGGSLTPPVGGSPGVRSCLSDVFARRIADVAPLPLYLYLGAVDDPGSVLSPVPVLAAAGAVAALAVVVSVLLSRRVLRPIRALTTASQRLGEGDLGERVPVVGRDELATLARSFNRMADSLQRGEERQRRLIADVAHELRTPLANVRGYLEALRDGVVAPDRELFASLYEEAVLQQRVVDDLQELALAEAGALVYHRSRVDVGELLEVSRTAHQAVADAAGVRLSVAAEAATYAHGDPDRLRQVLGNVVANAVRATPPGGRVELRTVRSGSEAVVTISDTGAGIAPEHLPHVFDRFWRADPARERRTGGSGLGLAIARQIVSDHGGTIEVASEVGKGTSFTIRLPAHGPASTARLPGGGPAASSQPGDGAVQQTPGAQLPSQGDGLVEVAVPAHPEVVDCVRPVPEQLAPHRRQAGPPLGVPVGDRLVQWPDPPVGVADEEHLPGDGGPVGRP